MGTSVDVDAFAEEYNELAAELGSTRLVVEAFAKPLRRKFDVVGVFPGDVILGPALVSFSLVKLIFLGLKSFILEVFCFGSLSGGGPIGSVLGGGGAFGEGSGLLPLGNAAFAAVVAASLFPPTEPL